MAFFLCTPVDFEAIIPPAASYTATGGIGYPELHWRQYESGFFWPRPSRF